MAVDPVEPPEAAGRWRAVREQAFAHRLAAGVDLGEGLRERKKRLTRQLISDTATGMFLERGFDGVRVADVAAACEVSEKTIYNYFPTKESLLFDRFEDMETDIRRILGPGAPALSPVDAAVAVITGDLGRTFADWSEGDRPFDPTMIRRFVELVEQTPALRAAQREMTDRVVQVAAEAMAARAAVNPDDPEPQIAANAILGLWRVEYRSMRRYADGTRSAVELRDAVVADVRRAARLIDTGLWSFGLAVQGAAGRDQLRLAAEAANEARTQVLSAIRQARRAWRQLKAEAHTHDHHAHDHHAREPHARDPHARDHVRRRPRRP